MTAAAILQRAGLQTLCLDSKLYAGGMASTVELFDGYKFEIAGSLQFPTSRKVSAELGLDELPSVDLDVMSVSLRGIGDDPVIYYTDPMKLLTHLNDVHGAEAVNGMAGLMAWSQAPRHRPSPDHQKHAPSKTAFLTHHPLPPPPPPSARPPPPPPHLQELFTSYGGQLRLRSKVDEILVADGRVAGVRMENGWTLVAPVVISAVAPTSRSPAWWIRTRCRQTSARGSPGSTTAAATCRCISPWTAYPRSRRPTTC